MKTLDKLKNLVILEELAHGGMGAVHVGYNPSVRRLVAIKTLFKEKSRDQRTITRFLWERDIYQMLEHPNIVHYVDSGEVDGVNFIALEHVRGKPLNEVIAEKGKLPWKQAVEIVGAVADAMAHYHDKDLIHRDIKPENVLVSNDGVVKLIDFGIAVTSEQAANPDGSIVGTFNYSSPEQNQGRKLDERSDLYSLGLMLHETVTGKRVFQQVALNEVCQEQLKGDIPYPSAVESDVPRGLDHIVTKLLARDPNARYQKAKEILGDLEAFKDDPEGFDPASMFDDEGISAKWEQAKEALASKDFPRALRLVQAVATRKQDSAEIHAFLGKAYAGNGVETETITHFSKAIELEPEQDQHRLDFGIALYGLKIYDQAAEQFQGILDLVPDNPYAKRYLGLCEQALKAPPPEPEDSSESNASGADSVGGGVKSDSAGGAVSSEEKPPAPAAGTPCRKGNGIVYLWWGMGGFRSGKAVAGILLSLLQIALIALIAIPWTPVWAQLDQPTGPLTPLFAAGGPLAQAAPFKQWVVAGPAILLYLIFGILVPKKLVSSSNNPPS